MLLLFGNFELRLYKCNDSPAREPDYYAQLGDRLAQAYPVLGGSVTYEPCAYWGEPSATKPEVPGNLPSVLMVQSGYDMATPIEGALNAFGSLPGAKLVYVKNEMEHGVFPYNTPCVDAKVAAYLLDGTLPEEDVSSCPAKPLPGETQVYAPGGDVPPLGTQSLAAQTAQTPGSNPLYDLIHKRIRENAADFFSR